MILVIETIYWQAWAVSGGSEGIADHFYELVPDMAIEYPFELDTFQKEVSAVQILFYNLNAIDLSWLG